MRHTLMLAIVLALPLPACDAPDDEAELQALDVEDDVELDAEADRALRQRQAEDAGVDMSVDPELENLAAALEPSEAGGSCCFACYGVNAALATPKPKGVGCKEKADNFCWNHFQSFWWPYAYQC
jgi:hypothetical protein